MTEDDAGQWHRKMWPTLEALGSDGSFDGDLKVLLGCRLAFGTMETLGDLRELHKEISFLRVAHIRKDAASRTEAADELERLDAVNIHKSGEP